MKYTVCSTVGMLTARYPYAHSSFTTAYAMDIFNAVVNEGRMAATTPETWLGKLLLAVDSFGSAGCNSIEANHKAWPGVAYESDNNKFKDIGLFVEPANEFAKHEREIEPFLLESGRTNYWTKKPQEDRYLVGNLSRKAKCKWRISPVGRKFIDGYIKPNAKVAELFSYIKELETIMSERDVALASAMLFRSMSTGKPIIYLDETLADIEQLLSNPTISDVFGSKLLKYKKMFAKASKANKYANKNKGE